MPDPQPEDLAARQVAIDLTGDVALQDADDLLLGLSLPDSTFEVELGLGVVCDADHDDAPQRAVGLAIAAIVGLDLAVGLARSVRDGCDAAQVGPGTLRMQPVGVVAGRHHQCGCGVGTHSEEVQQIGDGGDEERLDALIKLGEFAVERFDAMRCANEESDALVAAVTGSGDRAGRSFVPSATRAGTERPFNPLRSCSGAL